MTPEHIAVIIAAPIIVRENRMGTASRFHRPTVRAFSSTQT